MHILQVKAVIFEKVNVCTEVSTCTVLPAKSDSDAMLCLQSYQGLRIYRSLVY